MVCYNVLCDAYVEPQYFPTTPQWVLDAHTRRTAILHQLTRPLPTAADRFKPHPSPAAGSGAAGDILCLQECDRFDSAWLPALSGAGFDGRFKKRTDSELKHTDGCAILWNKQKVTTTHTRRLSLTSALTTQVHANQR